MALNRAQLLAAAKAFCDAFSSREPLQEILVHFSAEDDGLVVFEHGLPELAPFLGRPFKGINGVKEYFDTISSLLSYNDMRFSDYVVDTEVAKVSVRGRARFTWTSTGQCWDEVFTYTLELDANCKVKKYEIWADTGAAYLACKGQLLPAIEDQLNVK